MGNSPSTTIDPNRKGYHILKVRENSPAFEAGLRSYFHFVIAVNGSSLDENASLFPTTIKNSIDQPVSLTVFSEITSDVAEYSITPRWWAQKSDGLIGCSIRYCDYQGALAHVWHIVDVLPNSPAQEAGLLVDTDYVIGTPESVIREQQDLYTLIASRGNDGQPLKLFVYNSLQKAVRDVTLCPRRDWGGEGLIGAELGYGALHKIPVDHDDQSDDGLDHEKLPTKSNIPTPIPTAPPANTSQPITNPTDPQSSFKVMAEVPSFTTPANSRYAHTLATNLPMHSPQVVEPASAFSNQASPPTDATLLSLHKDTANMISPPIQPALDAILTSPALASSSYTPLGQHSERGTLIASTNVSNISPPTPHDVVPLVAADHPLPNVTHSADSSAYVTNHESRVVEPTTTQPRVPSPNPNMSSGLQQTNVSSTSSPTRLPTSPAPISAPSYSTGQPPMIQSCQARAESVHVAHALSPMKTNVVPVPLKEVNDVSSTCSQGYSNEQSQSRAAQVSHTYGVQSQDQYQNQLTEHAGPSQDHAVQRAGHSHQTHVVHPTDYSQDRAVQSQANSQSHPPHPSSGYSHNHAGQHHHAHAAPSLNHSQSHAAQTSLNPQNNAAQPATHPNIYQAQSSAHSQDSQAQASGHSQVHVAQSYNNPQNNASHASNHFQDYQAQSSADSMGHVTQLSGHAVSPHSSAPQNTSPNPNYEESAGPKLIVSDASHGHITSPPHGPSSGLSSNGSRPPSVLGPAMANLQLTSEHSGSSVSTPCLSNGMALSSTSLDSMSNSGQHALPFNQNQTGTSVGSDSVMGFLETQASPLHHGQPTAQHSTSPSSRSIETTSNVAGSPVRLPNPALNGCQPPSPLANQRAPTMSNPPNNSNMNDYAFSQGRESHRSPILQSHHAASPPMFASKPDNDVSQGSSDNPIHRSMQSSTHSPTISGNAGAQPIMSAPMHSMQMASHVQSIPNAQTQSIQVPTAHTTSYPPATSSVASVNTSNTQSAQGVTDTASSIRPMAEHQSSYNAVPNQKMDGLDSTHDSMTITAPTQSLPLQRAPATNMPHVLVNEPVSLGNALDFFDSLASFTAPKTTSAHMAPPSTDFDKSQSFHALPTQIDPLIADTHSASHSFHYNPGPGAMHGSTDEYSGNMSSTTSPGPSNMTNPSPALHTSQTWNPPPDQGTNPFL